MASRSFSLHADAGSFIAEQNSYSVQSERQLSPPESISKLRVAVVEQSNAALRSRLNMLERKIRDSGDHATPARPSIDEAGLEADDHRKLLLIKARNAIEQLQDDISMLKVQLGQSQSENEALTNHISKTLRDEQATAQECAPAEVRLQKEEVRRLQKELVESQESDNRARTQLAKMNEAFEAQGKSAKAQLDKAQEKIKQLQQGRTDSVGSVREMKSKVQQLEELLKSAKAESHSSREQLKTSQDHLGKLLDTEKARTKEYMEREVGMNERYGRQQQELHELGAENRKLMKDRFHAETGREASGSRSPAFHDGASVSGGVSPSPIVQKESSNLGGIASHREHFVRLE
jgi:chromosome segregation ATPase